MKRFAAAVVLSMVIMGSGPFSCTSGNFPPLIWSAVVQCLSTPSQALVNKVIDILKQDGPSPNIGQAAITALEELGRQYGPDIVSCAIKWAIDALSPKGAVTVSREDAAAAAHGEQFLLMHGVHAKQ